MEIFIYWMAPISAICIGIMLLTIFFKFVNWIMGGGSIVKTDKVKGFLSGKKYIDVLLTSGKTIQSVKFIGFTQNSSTKTNIPHQLSSMAVFETEDGRRLLIRPDSIRIIEETKKEVEPGVSR